MINMHKILSITFEILNNIIDKFHNEFEDQNYISNYDFRSFIVEDI